jgi:hypothetical protein
MPPGSKCGICLFLKLVSIISISGALCFQSLIRYEKVSNELGKLYICTDPARTDV